MRLQIQSVDLVEIAKAAIDIVRPSATAKKIKLSGEWELHGGSVDVESAGENKGSTFTIVLPGATSRRTPGVVTSAQELTESA